MIIRNFAFPLNKRAGTRWEHGFSNSIGLLNGVLSVPIPESKISAYFLLNAGLEI